MGLTVVGIGAIFFVISALAYALTRAGVRVPSWVVLEDADELAVGLVCLFLSALAVLAGATEALAAAAGASPWLAWGVAALIVVSVAVPLGRAAMRRLPTELLAVQRRRDRRDGVKVMRTLGPGRHQR
jgi:hypothetical protein